MTGFGHERCPVCHRDARTNVFSNRFDRHTVGSQACSGSGGLTRRGRELQAAEDARTAAEKALVASLRDFLLLVETSRGTFDKGWTAPTEGTLWEKWPFVERARKALFEACQLRPDLIPEGMVIARYQPGAPSGMALPGPIPEEDLAAVADRSMQDLVERYLSRERDQEMGPVLATWTPQERGERMHDAIVEAGKDAYEASMARSAHMGGSAEAWHERIELAMEAEARAIEEFGFKLLTGEELPPAEWPGRPGNEGGDEAQGAGQ